VGDEIILPLPTFFRRAFMLGALITPLMSAASAGPADRDPAIEARIDELVSRMTLAEKIGQMSQVNGEGGFVSDDRRKALEAGRIGSILNEVDPDTVRELQRIAVEDSRLGIPLLIGRDVIHGFKTVMPIPLGQAATFNPALVERAAALSAREAARVGINWTFAPMIDISRDARWGRIAESLGEDPYLTSELAVAMVRGFQGDDLAANGTIAATAKHFAGYGAAEGGRDYATTNIPENELRNVYLPPFKATVDAGVATLMTSFSDVDGVPATANAFLLTDILREEWAFDGFVVSDWDSIRELSVHGLTANDREAAFEAATAGVDMEMAGDAYSNHLAGLVEAGTVSEATIDTAVGNILRVKFELGLFEDPYADPDALPPIASDEALGTARLIALQSLVLLENDGDTLPLSLDSLERIAVIGPLADAPYEQLGTWIFDGDPELSVTPLEAIRALLGEDAELDYVRAMETSRSRVNDAFDDAVAAASGADVAILFLGEESILSGEAHSRADIGLPGDQDTLARRIAETGTPVVAVILAGRPLTVAPLLDHVDALLFAWHPGTMAGPAIADVLFGAEAPSGKLPATFPLVVGQVPIYYNHKNTGKPPTPDRVVHIDDIEVRAPQTSFGMRSFYLDAGYQPLYPFGYGLSYTEFDYADIAVEPTRVEPGGSLTISATVTNTGDMAADEVVQLYVRDLAGNVTRPVRELKGFQRVRLEPGESARVEFELGTDALAFHGRDNSLMIEPGEFRAWIGGSSEADLETTFHVVDDR
jgi:beta-glucosidase